MWRIATLSATLALVACDGGPPRAAGQAPRPVRPPAAPEEPTPEPPAEPAAPPSRYAACPPRAAWPEGMACIPGGEVVIGDAEGEEDEREPGRARVSTFFLDVYEVTNERYRACVEARRCRPPAPYRRFRAARQPVVAVAWQDAVDFCATLGRRLPTDAEFERAARGPDQARYPWGDDESDPCARAVVKTRAGEGCGTEITADVGSRPAGHFGVHDLAGNVHEWVADHWAPCLRGCRRECGDACFGDDPRGPCGGADPCLGYPLRSIRGGSWYWSLEHARAAARRGAPPANEGGHRFGFRCAQSLSGGSSASTQSE